VALQRTLVVKEIVTTEKNYRRDLQIIIDAHYPPSILLSALIVEKRCKTVLAGWFSRFRFGHWSRR